MSDDIIACLCGCQRIARVRGVHSNCYERYRQLVKAGKTTWEELVKSGKLLPSKLGQMWRKTNFQVAKRGV